MRSNTPIQPINRLRHFPYENENMYYDNSKGDDKYRTMTQHNPFSTHGQPSNHPSEYLPESFFGYENHTSPFHQEPNTSLQMYPTPTDDMGSDWIKREEDREDEDEEDEKLPVIGRGKIVPKPPRKYMKKSEKQRNDPLYRDARDRNNAAVRKTREKAKKQQEEEKKKFEELKKEYQILKKKNEEMEKKMIKATAAINLIQHFKREFHNNPCRISSDIFPSLTEMLNFA